MFNIFRREGLSEAIDQIVPEDAARKISGAGGAEKALVIDVREPHEFNGSLGHIENAKLIPFKLLPLKINELEKHKDKEIIVVCHSGARSYSACSILKRHGFNKVYNLKGGMLLWKRNGFKSLI